jgi:hypothetical protein
VREADRIYVLHEGVVVESRTHDELVAREGKYNELYAIQARRYALIRTRPLHTNICAAPSRTGRVSAPLVDDDEAFLFSVREHRIGALAHEAVQSGQIEVSQDVARRLGKVALRTKAHHVQALAALRTATTWLSSAGFEIGTAKGLSAAYRWYPVPTSRQFSDIDLFLSPAGVERFGGAMAALGGEEGSSRNGARQTALDPRGPTDR